MVLRGRGLTGMVLHVAVTCPWRGRALSRETEDPSVYSCLHVSSLLLGRFASEKGDLDPPGASELLRERVANGVVWPWVRGWRQPDAVLSAEMCQAEGRRRCHKRRGGGRGFAGGGRSQAQPHVTTSVPGVLLVVVARVQDVRVRATRGTWALGERATHMPRDTRGCACWIGGDSSAPASMGLGACHRDADGDRAAGGLSADHLLRVFSVSPLCRHTRVGSEPWAGTRTEASRSLASFTATWRTSL